MQIIKKEKWWTSHLKTYHKCLFFSSLFPFYSCEFQFGVSYRETHNNAVRFHFVIRQSLGAIGKRLYLHCNVTICRRKDAPEPTIFNCFTHGEYCPNKTAELITKGPFVVWPFITKEERDKLKKQSSKRCYYSTIMSFYHIRSREGAKYEAVIHCLTVV